MIEKSTLEDIKPRILGVLEKSLQIKISDADINLVESGLLDSLSLIEFIVALETEFNVEVSFDDLDLEQFKTIDLIATKIISSPMKP